MVDGFLDKVRVSALQAVAQAQAGMAQGQAKLDAFQLKRQSDGLLRDLGAAYYAQQRSAGSPDAVAAALARLDAHVAQHGPFDPAGAAPPAAAEAPNGPGAGQAREAGGTTPPGGQGYSLDDL